MVVWIVGLEPSKRNWPGPYVAFNGPTGKLLNRLVGCEIHDVARCVNLTGLADIYQSIMDERPAIVFLCGRQVAMRSKLNPATRIGSEFMIGSTKVYVMPHPSGLNHMWNKASTREYWSTTLRSACNGS